ncbi:hypothetical protein CAPTEDRAFT_19411 [Capitella teleta]|uniref:ATP synthase mitochondrial F1 complex assembly factor 1 n=1 Tax=Capitella teleta TaxID=283909 RepID=R7VAB2_CAPTE|nr:hypothetical protein CAPTEDRAFT_19411 [Capitella teleta]|eukprot:ELU15477.1 hypothetical protein CAPTEDRAFT_19411 [Capitella teleta]
MWIGRCVLRTISQSVRPFRRDVFASSVRFSSSADMEHLKDNPQYSKYADKIRKMQQSNPEEFQSRIAQLDEQKKKEREEAKQRLEEMHKEMLEKQAQQTKPKSLGEVMKLELLQEKTKEEIIEIWKEYHKNKDCIFGVIPKDEYHEIYARSCEFKTFIYPLPREQGYEFFVQQFDGHDCHFTPLIEYQTHKENAPANLTLTHYTDLMEEKGIVLMHGYPDTKCLSVHESQLLALQLKLYYGLQSGLKFNLVRVFNNSPDNFRAMDVIKEFENYKKDALEKKQRDIGTPL